ncbi:hypothetical protein GA0115260_101515, partial [Streptomyces sp. MnatMP-M27]
PAAATEAGHGTAAASKAGSGGADDAAVAAEAESAKKP